MVKNDALKFLRSSNTICAYQSLSSVAICQSFERSLKIHGIIFLLSQTFHLFPRPFLFFRLVPFTRQLPIHTRSIRIKTSSTPSFSSTLYTHFILLQSRALLFSFLSPLLVLSFYGLWVPLAALPTNVSYSSHQCDARLLSSCDHVIYIYFCFLIKFFSCKAKCEKIVSLLYMVFVW